MPGVKVRNPITLGLLVAISAWRGLSYLFEWMPAVRSIKKVIIVDDGFPLIVYGVIWLAAVLILLVGLFRLGRMLVWGGSLLAAVWWFWGLGFAISQFNGNPYGVQTGAMMVAIGFSVLTLVQQEADAERSR